MSKFDWERRGPPRPGSSNMDHPGPIERPYVHVTDAQRRQRREELAKEAKERGRAIRKAELAEFFRLHGCDPDGNPLKK